MRNFIPIRFTSVKYFKPNKIKIKRDNKNKMNILR